MNKEDSLYERELELLQLQEQYHKQEKLLRNKSKLEQLSMIKECYQVLDDIARTSVNFQVKPPIDGPYLKIPRKSASDLQNVTHDAVNFLAQANQVEQDETSINLVRINELATAVHNDRVHLDMCQSILNNSETVVENLSKLNQRQSISNYSEM